MRRNAFLLALEQIGAGILSGSPELSLPCRSWDSQWFSGVVVFAMLGFSVVLRSCCLCHVGAGILKGSPELSSLTHVASLRFAWKTKTKAN